MADSIREQIVEAAMTLLDAVGKPAGLTIHRNRARAIESDSLPAVVVYLAQESGQRAPGGDNPLTLRRLRLRLEHRVRDPVPDEALDPLLQWATRQLCAAGAFGALVNDDVAEVQVQWAAEELDRVYGAAAQDFEVLYQTLADDQTQAE